MAGVSDSDSGHVGLIMAVSDYSPFSLADLDALAALANAKLTPPVPFAFTAFAGEDQITLPTNVTAMPIYNGTGYADGQKVTLWLFPYKTISGRKTFSWNLVVKPFTGTPGAGGFQIQWSWTAPTATTTLPDGYIAAIPQQNNPGWVYYWKDLGNVTTFYDYGYGDETWSLDRSLAFEANQYPTDQNLPCAHGTWLKQLQRIWCDLLYSAVQQTVVGSGDPFPPPRQNTNPPDSWYLSGPWCVSVNRCFPWVTGAGGPLVSVYRNLKCYWAKSDSATANIFGLQFLQSILPTTLYAGPPGDMVLNFGRSGYFSGSITFLVQYVDDGSPNTVLPDPGAQSNWTLTAPAGVAITFGPGAGATPATKGVTITFTFANIRVANTFEFVANFVKTSGEWWATIVSNNVEFHSDAQAGIVAADAVGIHPSSPLIVASLSDNPADIVVTQTSGQICGIAATYKSAWLLLGGIQGVFAANTLPTPGIMPFLDQDLPQYHPVDSQAAGFADSRRMPIAGATSALPYVSSVDNRAALWPCFRDTDFKPSLVGPYAVDPSLAWSQSLASKYVAISNPGLNGGAISVPPYSQAGLWAGSVFVDQFALDVRFYASNTAVTLLVKANAIPTLTDFDASISGGQVLSLKTAVPGFETDTTWFYAIYNPGSGTVATQVAINILDSLTAPNGTFFATQEADDGSIIPINEGISYGFQQGISWFNLPTPMSGYCVYEVSLRRQPVDGIAPAGEADLAVTLGTMVGFGFDAQGVFAPLQTFTIPKGQQSIRVPVFWPVVAGTPLAYQSAEVVVVRCAVNFQPMLHSSWNPQTKNVFSNPFAVGYFNGPPWFSSRPLVFFRNGFISDPILLPICASIYEDVSAVLGLL